MASVECGVKFRNIKERNEKNRFGAFSFNSCRICVRGHAHGYAFTHRHGHARLYGDAVLYGHFYRHADSHTDLYSHIHGDAC